MRCEQDGDCASDKHQGKEDPVAAWFAYRIPVFADGTGPSLLVVYLIAQ